MSKSIVIAAGTMTLCVVAMMLIWVSQEYRPANAAEVAQEFVDLLDVKQIAKAHELTTKDNGYVGRTPQELEQILQRHPVHCTHLVDVISRQSNGNRVRRWLVGGKADVDEVDVEFDGEGLLRVSLRNVGDNQWLVSRFGHHAG